jgi:hypothetical protein
VAGLIQGVVMAGAARFLYGLALGFGLGIICSRLFAAASSGSHRRPAWSGRRRPPPRACRHKRPREEVAAR